MTTNINAQIVQTVIVARVGSVLRIVYLVDELADLNDVPVSVRYEGMIVYVKGNSNSYQLKGGIENDDWALLIGGGGASWGSIGGTLSNQTDLQAALNLKANISSLGAVATSNNYNDLSNLPTLGTMAAQAAADYQLLSEKGQANGYAPLNANNKIPTSYIPDVAISEYEGDFTDLATALADPGVQASQRGDWFTVQTGGGATYIVISDNPTVAGDVRIMATPTADVTSVNGQTGVVVLDTDDIAEGATNLYWTQARFNTAFGNKNTDDLAEGTTNKYNQTHTGDVTGSTALIIANNAVTTAKINNSAVTFAKIQDISGTILLGRHAGGSGVAQEVSVGNGLEFSGSGIRREALIGDVAASAGSNTTAIQPTAISGKTLDDTLTGTEEVLINVGGTLFKTTVQDIADLGGGGGGGLGYTLTESFPRLSYAASTTYNFGYYRGLTQSVAECEIEIPKPFTMKKISINWYHAGATGTAGTVTVRIMKNGSIAETLTGFSLTGSATGGVILDANTAFVEGDTFAMQRVTPAWATPPTNTFIGYVAYGE